MAEDLLVGSRDDVALLYDPATGKARHPVVLVDENGAPIALGGGTQYEEGDANDPATGTGALARRQDAAGSPVSDGEFQLLLVDAAGNLRVGVVSVPADPFGLNADAVVAAGAAGSMQAKLRRLTTDLGAALTALQIIDDWEESDRAKVNPIAGQAGVQGGAGVVTALSQRVAIATDANLVTTPETEAAHDSGTVTGATLDSNGTSWTSALANGSSMKILILEVWNRTDGWIQVSFDGGTTVHATIPRGGAISRDYKANQAKETSAVHVRELSGEDVTEGRVAVNVVWIAA